jgi:hypothetical protein
VRDDLRVSERFSAGLAAGLQFRNRTKLGPSDQGAKRGANRGRRRATSADPRHRLFQSRYRSDAPEKRIADLQEMVSHLRKRGEAPFCGLRLAMAVHGWWRQVVPNTRPIRQATGTWPGHRFTFERTAACSDQTRTGDSAGIRPPARSFPRLPQPPHRPRGQPLSLPGQRRASLSWEAVRAPSGPARRGHSLRRFFRTPAHARQYAQFEPNTRSVRPLSRLSSFLASGGQHKEDQLIVWPEGCNRGAGYRQLCRIARPAGFALASGPSTASMRSADGWR